MMSPAFRQLRKAYADELRESKEMAERWWQDLNENSAKDPGSLKPDDLWPMGPASHPWVIATFRKFFFACVELNKRVSEQVDESNSNFRGEQDWGQEDTESSVGTIDPKIFAYEMLSGGDTHDLY